MTETLDLTAWIGRSETRSERIAPFPANALAATLNRDDPEYTEGSDLPPLWHWLHFLPVYKLSDAGYDGHAALGGFLPPVPLPRRMWAGSRLRFIEPLRIGRALRKVSTVRSVAPKEGRTGQLVFVTVGHQVFDNETLCVEEEHDIVYREAPRPSDPVPPPPAAPDSWDFARDVHPDPVMLFRYSALTFNGHRIHYDQPFCVTTEGYEGLVVHGPLLATLLLDLLRREKPEAIVKSFEFRAISTVFDTTDFSVHGAAEADGKTFRLWARRHDGALAMQARATIA
ncbi:FAS1-like dehydratase domain-containing protein [Ruegeria aquimaris]|uniref:MaoC family dehydratase N-terminal domain-containing protein n=1 Tax=Ruegeria aquimaris TaxID=2984333 RepID=A0ABT3AKE3_9RHOB|nr:MaoC family dehydratase N-terminal domain-containing protein [Ruegeria sp. XHP0148]MCV2889128.1 MaoC family dehydratase N-terminal domain-containing protein [Ruegeria sp. XHP0148]